MVKLEDIKKTIEVESGGVEGLTKQGYVLLKIVKIKDQDAEKLVYVLGKS